MTANEKLIEIQKLAAQRKSEILSTKSDYPKAERTFYVDDKCGVDTNDGLSPETAWKTLEKVKVADLREGDVVLFKRGGLWRGSLIMQQGVSISAYGEGEKPKIYGSYDASGSDNWMETEIKNVWKYIPQISYVKDVGCLVIDDGRLWGIKVCTNQSEGVRCDGTHDAFNGRTVIKRDRVPFKDYRDLKNDLEFYHNPSDEHIYLYCADGNPGEVFGSIELGIRRTILCRGRDVTIDNICLKYAGIHGVGHSGYNVTVKNCEIGWIGGSSQFTEQLHFRKNHPFNHQDVVRLGNGIEVYGACNNYVIENCYIYQNYDCGVTAQWMGWADKDMIMQNIVWKDNLFDSDHYAFELWLAANGIKEGCVAKIKDVELSGNIIINGGCGWSHQRNDDSPMDFCCFNNKNNKAKAENVNIHNNIFAGGRGAVFHAGTFLKNNNMKFFDNTVVFHEGARIFSWAKALLGEDAPFHLDATPENFEKTKKYFEGNEIYLSDITPTIKEATIKI